MPLSIAWIRRYVALVLRAVSPSCTGRFERDQVRRGVVFVQGLRSARWPGLAAGRSGSRRHAASPATSRSELRSEQATGTARPIASVPASRTLRRERGRRSSLRPRRDPPAPRLAPSRGSECQLPGQERAPVGGDRTPTLSGSPAKRAPDGGHAGSKPSPPEAVRCSCAAVSPTGSGPRHVRRARSRPEREPRRRSSAPVSAPRTERCRSFRQGSGGGGRDRRGLRLKVRGYDPRDAPRVGRVPPSPCPGAPCGPRDRPGK